MTDKGLPGKTADEPQYNPLFSVFTDENASSSRISGLIAYALYKQPKVDWATDFRDQNGHPPSADDLKAYQRTWTPGLVAAMREQADGALAGFGDDAVEQAKPAILKDALRGSFWKAVWSSMVAAFFYSLVLIALVLILRWNGVDVIGLFQKLDVR